ncbi:hypothetical protein VI35_20290 [Aeromonas caviae]|uniref:hypothetical protein n=1 Tax=Aeromonas caviae TaxID=648 RepID=UPI0009BBC6A6|nr:hypothetical protein [Aeromonas caviae]ATP92090.1 hypothetical protein VI35_20290 [Aeromonas caviae]
MLDQVQLNILNIKLKEISESPYFSTNLNSFVRKLNGLAAILLRDYTSIENHIVKSFIQNITSATNFFTGSTTKKIPYEIVFCLEDACEKWIDEKTIITTALSPDIHGFYFSTVERTFYDLSSKRFGIDFEHKLIQISLPEMYRRKPLFVTPLYHELGHFIDITIGISDIAFLICQRDGLSVINDLYPPNLPKEISEQDKNRILMSHCREYFADLFSAQFIGYSGIKLLQEIAGDHDASFTHPSTSNRVSIVSDFLQGNKNSIIELFNFTISILHSHGKLRLPSLTACQLTPDISDAFDNARPYRINSRDEMHAFVNSGWEYLCSAKTTPRGCWSGFAPDLVEGKINDLVEKSIRNYILMEKWGQHAPTE